MQPPKRPAPDARGLPVARQDIVPGIPRQALAPRVVEAARIAARASSPEIHDVQIDALDKRLDTVENGLERMVSAVDGLTDKVSQWELTAAGGEAVKIQEEQKTKRWTAMIGVVTMIVAPLGTAITNYVTRDPPKPPPIQVYKSAMQIEEEACRDAPSDDAWAKCVTDVAIRNAPSRRK